VSQRVRELYIIPNPYYYDLIRLGKNAQFASKTKQLSFGGNLPPGAAYWSAVDKNPLPKGDIMTRGKLIYPDSTLVMRPYQVEPIEYACTKRCALIKAPTGSGKTAMASEIIRNSGQKTLVLCHSTELMHQFAKEIKEFLGVTPKCYFGNPKYKEFGNITVTTYMSAVQNFNEFAAQGFGLLIVDEADCFATDNYLSFLCNFPYKRAFGFTATTNKEKFDQNMKREVGFMARIWGLEVEVKTNIQADVLEKIVMHRYEKVYKDEYGLPILSKDWIEFRKVLDEDQERKRAQIELISGAVDSGDSAIVLLDRVDDVDQYYQELSFHSQLPVYKLHGKMRPAERKDMVAAFKKDGGILVSNVKIAGRGFSVVAANKAFIMCPMKGETAVVQAVGRILRWMPDKKSTLYDWSDSSLAGQLRKRKKTYKTFYVNAEII